MASHGRSVAKALSWRAAASALTVGVVWGWTGDAAVSWGIGTIDAIAKVLLYYLHERAWNLSDWGR